MSDPSIVAKHLFSKAIEIESSSERAAWLREVCGEDTELLAVVEHLLAARNQPDDSMCRPAIATDATPVTSAQPALPERYRVVAEIARGGMGAVWRVVDQQFNRPMAVKVMLPLTADVDEARARFEREARLTGSLQHPAIPPVVDRGVLDDETPFFSMKLVEGLTLAQLLAERTAQEVDLPRFLGILEQVCQAVGYGHSRGVIHRDLKPSNIMVGAFGEVQVMDWGMAKRIDSQAIASSPAAASKPAVIPAEGTHDHQTDETATYAPPVDGGEKDTNEIEKDGHHTQMGSVVGTLAYMAPEQARGEVDNVDARSDVFGLGAILCEILIGERPYEASKKSLDMQSLWKQAAAAELSAAFSRIDRSGVDAELIDLCKRCLAADASRRPTDGSTVAEELQAYQQSVQQRLQKERTDRAAAEARAVEQQKRLRIERAKRRVTLALAVSVFLLATGGGATAWWYKKEEIAEETATRIRAQQAQVDIGSSLTRAAELRDAYGFEAADTLVSQAERRLSAISEPRQLAIRVQQAKADLEVVRRLDGIRTLKATWTNEGMDNEFANGRDGAYALAFRDYGIQVFGDESPKDVGGRIGQCNVSVALLAALDDWASGDSEHASRILAIARAAKDDSFRNRLRDPDVFRNRDTLCELAELADPNSLTPPTLDCLAYRLASVGEAAAALELLTRASMRYPADFWLRFRAASILESEPLQRPLDAIGHYRAAMAIRPRSAAVHFNLGNVLKATNQLSEAERAFRRAIELDPELTAPYNALGILLQATDRAQEAEAAFRKAIKADPKDARAHYNLALLLMLTQRLQEAETAFLQAIEARPTHANALYNLGVLLMQQNRLAEAEKALRSATDADPNLAPAHYNLGILLVRIYRLAAAETSLRRSIDIDPTLTQPHFNLGILLLQGNRLREAEAEFEMAVETEPTLAGQVEDLLRLNAKLVAVQNEAQSPGSPAETLALADFAVRTLRPRLAVELFVQSLNDAMLSPELRFQHEYNAACAALICADGHVEKGAAPPDAKEAARLRKQGLAWLQANLAGYEQMLNADPNVHTSVIEQLRHWQKDVDLTTVRGEAIDQLPETERTGWHKFWKGVATMIERQPATPRP